MNGIRLFAVATVLAISAPAAMAQQNANIRGVITAFEGNVISIKANDGSAISVDLPEAVAVAITKPFSMADVKPGMKLGVTTIRRADGATVAIDVRPIPAAVNEGLSSYDLQPQSTMTNAVLEATAQTSGADEITLNYKTGTVKVLVPPGTPMSQSTPGARADVKAGETIFIAARKEEGGKLVAARMPVSKDGVKPTQ